jgi:dihydroorotate dehydrogenase electron transfer subunit
MIQLESSVLSNEQLTENCWRITLEAPQIASEIKPGQFINVKISQTHDPFFRRPFSVFRRVKGDRGYSGIEVIYEVIGRGTEIMTNLRRGDELDIIGPLGHGFEWYRDKKVHVLLSSETGAAGLFLLGEEISKTVNEYGLELYILLDAKSKKTFILEDEFRTLNGKVLVSTHNGTYGYHGYVTEMLKNSIDSGEISVDCVIYACGPELMLKALLPICKQYGIPAQVSMQRHMGCGIGACLSCVCKVNKASVLKYRDVKSSHIQFSPEAEFGYALVCKDGPVFNIEEVLFDE